MKKVLVLLFCLLASSSLFSQENTILGTGALSQASTPKYAIQQIQVSNPSGGYSRPTINMGNHNVQWDYLYIDVGFYGVECYGYFSTTTDLGSFVPTLTGGYGTGATVYMYLSYFDGTNYYYELYTDNYGSGYVPEVTLSSSTGGSFQISTYINENGELVVNYYDGNKTNLYVAAPVVSVSFGGATATAILESTAANAQNTAIGYQALYNASAANNVALGDRAGSDLTTGKNNIFIGPYAGKGITTGSGNTILGATNNSLTGSLSNSVLLADGNSNSRLFFTPNGNALIGYGNTFTDNGYRLDVNGNSRFTGKVQAHSIDGYEAISIPVNTVLEASPVNNKKLFNSPFSSVYHDVFAFNKRGLQITYEESSNNVSFVSGTPNMSFFAHKTGTSAQIDILGPSGNKAVRWTWSNATYTNSQWLALDYGAVSGPTYGYVTVKVEHSANNITWTTAHTSSYSLSGSGFSRYHWVGYTDDSPFFRLTITHNGGSTIRLCGIRLLSNRLGNQGGTPEFAYPYTWNKDGWMGINKGTSEPEYPLDVTGVSRFNGAVILNEPATSTGNYEVLTRNTSTGTLEKIVANNIHKTVDWINAPGADANTIEENTSSFTYSNNAPAAGPLTHFGNGGYGLQLNSAYNGTSALFFRTRNNDSNFGWNNWKKLLYEDINQTWDINVGGSAQKWNGNTFDGGNYTQPAYFATSLGSGIWGYSSLAQLKSTIAFSLQDVTSVGSTTTNTIHANGAGGNIKLGGVTNSGGLFQNTSGDNLIYLSNWTDNTKSIILNPVSGNVTIGGNIQMGRNNAYLLSYASLSETQSGASTILGNNVVAGAGVNTIKRNINPADNGSFVALNYHHGITFHTGVQTVQNVDAPMYDSEKMRITQNGNVGIGVNSPQEKLAVNGKIRAREVKVEPTNGWPDYVFEDSYKPLSLSEISTFIKKNKHLPEMPSAKEVEQNGLELGEMNKLLLKKIEELTLHLIEKEKQLTQTNSRIDELSELVKKLIQEQKR